MTNKSLGMDALISHRFRGFSQYENTLEGFIAALDFGVQYLEFDIRAAACGTPMIYHDEYAHDGQGTRRLLCDYKASSYSALGGDFARMPSFDALLHTAAAHKNNTARLLIDIKDTGFEHEIHALVMLYKVQERTIYVSWQADVLFRLHEIAPEIPLCFSHWSMAVTPKIMTDHIVYKAKNGNVTPRSDSHIIGERSGWSVDVPLTGKMLDILIASGGGVCVPQVMLTRALSDHYHEQALFVSTFSYTDWNAINEHDDKLNIDLYFIDNKRVFEELL